MGTGTATDGAGAASPGGRAAELIDQLPRGSWQERSFAFWTGRQLQATDRWWQPLSAAVLGATSAVVSAAVALGFRNVVVVDLHKLTDVLEAERTRPIITVSNHESGVDDPLLWGIMPWRLWTPDNTRWTMGAQELLYKTPPLNAFFALGQTIPTIRGAGIHQLAVEIGLHKLNHNKWVHVFPEGKINQGPGLLRFKWGVGRLVMEAERTPVVVPIFFSGLREVLPLRQPVPVPWLNPFKRELYVRVGDPIDLSAQVREWRAARSVLDSPEAAAQLDRRVRAAISERLRAAVDDLKTEFSCASAPPPEARARQPSQTPDPAKPA
ncbi:Lyso-phosphatidylcholine acyltransferase [Coemansia helicoidea]|uniref:Lyso-phosphatidylcholine acyltransferase n=1 Tax=Coemansia helicoidea TaxID=1286919 RepID=A0ACC1KYI3_9FUNG|nr:Lyso-phosphatidylcholine acyltransferase [Coemansia helicoidea]